MFVILHWEFLAMLVSLFPFSFLQTQRGYNFSWHNFLLHSRRLRLSLWSTTVRDIPWDDIFKQGVFLLFPKFVNASRLELICFIPHFKYKVKPYLYPWFATGSATAIAHNISSLVQVNSVHPQCLKAKFSRTSNWIRDNLWNAISVLNKSKSAKPCWNPVYKI